MRKASGEMNPAGLRDYEAGMFLVGSLPDEAFRPYLKRSKHPKI